MTEPVPPSPESLLPAFVAPGMGGVRQAERVAKPRLIPSPGLGAWLRESGGSLAFTTYQTGRLFFLSADAQGETVAQERIVGAAMGLSATPGALWVSNQQQVWRFSNIGSLTLKGETWDAIFMPRRGYLLGACDTHDILANVTYGGVMHELAFVNTSFSCVAAIDSHYGFRPFWKPDFITALALEDRCHLNGFCARDNELAYVTLCGRYDTPIGWKAVKSGGGCVVEMASQEILCQGLSMPHAPRWHHGRLWLHQSGTGDFGYLDLQSGRFNPVTLCPGFARGLVFVGDYAVIGLSRLRTNTFASGLAIQERLERLNIPQRCGLLVVDLKSGEIVHWLTILGEITELYDVAFLSGITRPYTPGFSEPQLHMEIMHIVPEVYPVAETKKYYKKSSPAPMGQEIPPQKEHVP